MISLYTGTPGSGKSYHATERIDINLKQGVNVICNYKIKTNRSHRGDFVYLDNNNFSVKYLVEYAINNHDLDGDKPKEHQTLIVVDEAAVVFPSKDIDIIWYQGMVFGVHIQKAFYFCKILVCNQ